MAKSKKTTLLTNLEVAVMRVIWDAAPRPLTVREVADELNRDRRKPLAYNTVQTVLTILKDKGVARARPGAGRAHEFSARLSREEASTSMVGDLVDRLFDGQAHALLLKLVEHESLSRAELLDLKQLIEQELQDEPEDR